MVESSSERGLPGGSKRFFFWGVVVATPLGVLAFVLIFWPVTAGETPTSRANACRNHLKQIGLALHNYHDKYGSFPPAYVVDEDGNRMHSWRAFILPFVDEATLYHQYRFDEPWNGPHNQVLHERINVNARGCPGDPVVYRTVAGTNYVAVVGPETAWPGDRAMRLEELEDGPESTILLIEASPALVNWFEPHDLTFESTTFSINGPDQTSLSSYHATEPSMPWQNAVPYVHVLMVDGSVKRLPASTPPETVRALLTIAGGEDVHVDWIRD